MEIKHEWIGESTMDESNVDIKYEPFKEIVVMQQNVFSSPDDIARFASIIAGGKTTGLYWAEGMVFLYFPLPASTETAAKALIENRQVYWTFVGYAPMANYRPIIETKEKIMIPVIDMSSNPMFRKVAKWLKEQK
jgi:hypothetical protein